MPAKNTNKKTKNEVALFKKRQNATKRSNIVKNFEKDDIKELYEMKCENNVMRVYDNGSLNALNNWYDLLEFQKFSYIAVPVTGLSGAAMWMIHQHHAVFLAVALWTFMAVVIAGLAGSFFVQKSLDKKIHWRSSYTDKETVSLLKRFPEKHSTETSDLHKVVKCLVEQHRKDFVVLVEMNENELDDVWFRSIPPHRDDEWLVELLEDDNFAEETIEIVRLMASSDNFEAFRNGYGSLLKLRNMQLDHKNAEFKQHEIAQKEAEKYRLELESAQPDFHEEMENIVQRKKLMIS